ncbi:MAG: 23S rRNA (uracil(1939)-C(5))-methyltransferase RlmD [Deltaproteobacteria bacterium]|nr:23S rRNA (uracil(1939)-C(5))-methyltransferase RlmD [Deltaproteobacteria bacterium]
MRTQRSRNASSIDQGKYIPPCPHYPACFGCPLISVPYPEQLLRKRRIVENALAACSNLSGLEVPPVVSSPRRLGYRARIKLVVRRGNKGVLTGLYLPQSHQVVDISSCPVHPPAVNRVVQFLKREIQRLGIAPYDETDDTGELRYIDIRFSFWQRKIALALVTRHASFFPGAELSRNLKRRFSFIEGVVQNINEERGNVIWGDRFRSLSGRDTLLERFGWLKLRLPNGVFSQANPAVARRIYETVAALANLNGEETVLDLFCGVGPISLYLAASARLVWGTDENPLAIATAKQNARMNGFHNCRFVEGDVSEILNHSRLNLPKIDLAVLNPPRKGIQPAAMDALISLQVPRMIYVSCDPVTLARDLDRLAGRGYQPLRIQPFDMFPQTEQVETVTLLEKV